MKTGAFLLLALFSAPGFATGEDLCNGFDSPFSRDMPAMALSQFTAGKLGVLDPSFQRVYRIAAWRVLEGKPLTTREKEQLSAAFSNGNGDDPAPAQKAWQEALGKYAGGVHAAPISDFTRTRQTEFGGGLTRQVHYGNCTSASFESAARTLAARAGNYGAASKNPWVKAWAQGQADVFANCAAGFQLPQAAPAQAPLWFRQDRAYQRAAAHFYAGHFDEARGAFEIIAKDKASPWAASAPYLAARSLLRQGSLSADPVERAQRLAQASERFKGLALGGPADLRESSAGLARRADIELDPASALARLEAAMAAPSWGKDATGDLEGLVILLRRAAAKDPIARRAFVARDGGLAEWATEFANAPSVQPSRADCTSNAGTPSVTACERATGAAHRHAWTTLCYMQARKEDDIPPAVAVRAAALGTGDPAYATVTYNRLRLRMDRVLARPTAQTSAQLYRDLSAEIKLGESIWGKDGMNALHVLRSGVSQSPAGFLADKRVHVFARGRNDAGWQHESPREPVDKDLAEAWSARDLYASLPLSRMATLARDPGLPPAWSESLAETAMARAALLGHWPLAREMAALRMARPSEQNPELKEFIDARNEVARNYVLARLIEARAIPVAPDESPIYLPWLSAAERVEAGNELAALRKRMAHFHASALFARAAQSPRDPRLADDLAFLALRSEGQVARRADALLMELFPR